MYTMKLFPYAHTIVHYLYSRLGGQSSSPSRIGNTTAMPNTTINTYLPFLPLTY